MLTGQGYTCRQVRGARVDGSGVHVSTVQGCRVDRSGVHVSGRLWSLRELSL